MVTGTSREVLETEVRPWIEAFLAQRGLRLSATKTRIVHIDEGFDFLGWNFRKYSGKLLIKPSKKNVKTFHTKLREVIGGSLGLKQEKLIRLLNPMLRGWAQYHSPVVAKKTFSYIDSLLFWRLTRWAKRRHPKKSTPWIRRKYWRTDGNRNGVFAADEATENGGKRVMALYSLADTTIKRHKKVKGDYHPYDPEWETYGETLRQERMEDKMRYRREWATLYVQQSGLCAHRGLEMNENTGWRDHHIVYRVMGGSDSLSNRVLLHPNCHAQVHSLGLTVVKPVPA